MRWEQSQENLIEYRKPASLEWTMNWQKWETPPQNNVERKNQLLKLSSDLHVGRVLCTCLYSHTHNDTHLKWKSSKKQENKFAPMPRVTCLVNQYSWFHVTTGMNWPASHLIHVCQVICLLEDIEWVFSGSTYGKQSTFSVTVGM